MGMGFVLPLPGLLPPGLGLGLGLGVPWGVPWAGVTLPAPLGHPKPGGRWLQRAGGFNPVNHIAEGPARLGRAWDSGRGEPARRDPPNCPEPPKPSWESL